MRAAIKRLAPLLPLSCDSTSVIAARARSISGSYVTCEQAAALNLDSSLESDSNGNARWKRELGVVRNDWT